MGLLYSYVGRVYICSGFNTLGFLTRGVREVRVLRIGMLKYIGRGLWTGCGLWELGKYGIFSYRVAREIRVLI
jgi:hypothetical protein